VSDAPLVVTEVTELAGEQPLVRQLVAAAFRERLGEVDVACEFHRGWNEGWKCRAEVRGKRLEFSVLRVGEEIVAWPAPFPEGWRKRGVMGSGGGRYGVSADGELVVVDRGVVD
jgi:hypothetical protein